MSKGAPSCSRKGGVERRGERGDDWISPSMQSFSLLSVFSEVRGEERGGNDSAHQSESFSPLAESDCIDVSQAFRWSAADKAASKAMLDALAPRGGDLAMIMFTSGSTGTPKGATAVLLTPPLQPY